MKNCNKFINTFITKIYILFAIMILKKIFKKINIKGCIIILINNNLLKNLNYLVYQSYFSLFGLITIFCIFFELFEKIYQEISMYWNNVNVEFGTVKITLKDKNLQEIEINCELLLVYKTSLNLKNDNLLLNYQNIKFTSNNYIWSCQGEYDTCVVDIREGKILNKYGNYQNVKVFLFINSDTYLLLKDYKIINRFLLTTQNLKTSILITQFNNKYIDYAKMSNLIPIEDGINIYNSLYKNTSKFDNQSVRILYIFWEQGVDVSIMKSFIIEMRALKEKDKLGFQGVYKADLKKEIINKEDFNHQILETQNNKQQITKAIMYDYNRSSKQ